MGLPSSTSRFINCPPLSPPCVPLLLEAHFISLPPSPFSRVCTRHKALWLRPNEAKEQGLAYANRRSAEVLALIGVPSFDTGRKRECPICGITGHKIVLTFHHNQLLPAQGGKESLCPGTFPCMAFLAGPRALYPQNHLISKP